MYTSILPDFTASYLIVHRTVLNADLDVDFVASRFVASARALCAQEPRRVREYRMESKSSEPGEGENVN